MTSIPDSARQVLIVEDDPDVRQTLVEILGDFDYHPIIATNGQEALDHLRASPRKPCVILLDLMMPLMDGWTFRQVQSTDAELKTIPVILLTANTRAEQTAAQMSAAGYLMKPIKLDQLLEALARHCGAAA